MYHTQNTLRGRGRAKEIPSRHVSRVVGSCPPRALDDHGAGRRSRGSGGDDTVLDAILHRAGLHELLVTGELGRLLPVVQ